MYQPEHFRVNDPEEAWSFLEANSFGWLISLGGSRLQATPLPFLLSADRRFLRAHLARQNPQWHELDEAEVLVSFLGPHAYVSPSWYTQPGVPTWNYSALQVRGTCRLFHDSGRLELLVRELTDKHEARLPSPWQAAPPGSKLKSIVGLEVQVDEIECKYKLNQNRSKAEQSEVARRLEELGSTEVAQAMRRSLDSQAGD